MKLRSVSCVEGGIVIQILLLTGWKSVIEESPVKFSRDKCTVIRFSVCDQLLECQKNLLNHEERERGVYTGVPGSSRKRSW